MCIIMFAVWVVIIEKSIFGPYSHTVARTVLNPYALVFVRGYSWREKSSTAKATAFTCFSYCASSTVFSRTPRYPATDPAGEK